MQQSVFRIGDAARIIGVTPTTLRNWEKAGLIQLSPHEGKNRLYTQANIEQLSRIKYLISVKGFNIAGLREHLESLGELDIPESIGARYENPAIMLGQKLRLLRTTRGLTLEDVSAVAGLSSSYLSRIESGQVNVSITTLQRLATFYGTTLLHFFDEDNGGSETLLVRAGAGKLLQTDENGIRIALLSCLSNHIIESLLYHVAPGAGRTEDVTHEGEEFVYVLSGLLEVCLDDKTVYTLSTGDSIQYKSSRRHRWRNSGTSELIAIWVNTPPSF